MPCVFVPTKQQGDEAISSVSDLAFPVTNSSADIAMGEIAQFQKSNGYRVIFSTYHSSPLIAEAQQDKSVPHFDLIVADEAHRCAGKVASPFATVLDGTKLRTSRRLFATATPRIYKSSLKKKAEEVGVEVVDMDDEEIGLQRHWPGECVCQSRHRAWREWKHLAS